MATPKKPTKNATRRALTAASTHRSGIAKLLELIAEEMGERGRATRLASKARMAGDPEMCALIDLLQGWRDEDFARWHKELTDPPRPPR
jgi:hypothetical protein